MIIAQGSNNAQGTSVLRPEETAYPSRAVINLDAITHNLKVLREAAPNVKHMAVVKGGAYGHGMVPVALAAHRAGANWFGVAQLQEALDLRAGLDAAGIPRDQAPILTWIAASGAPWTEAIEADLDLSVSWLWALMEISAAAREVGRPARIHLKVDTGMSRAGSTPDDLPVLAAAVREAVDEGTVELVGAWSHFSRADDPTAGGQESTARHIRIFEQGLDVLKQAGLTPQIRHIAATSGALWHPESHYDMVRDGIGMYGLSPDPSVATSAELGLIPAMTLQAPLTSVKLVAEGSPVSYGGTWVAPTPRWLGLVPLGYADGIPRAASNQGPVTVMTDAGALTTHVVGRICMDQFIIDLGPGPDPAQHHHAQPIDAVVSAAAPAVSPIDEAPASQPVSSAVAPAQVLDPTVAVPVAAPAVSPIDEAPASSASDYELPFSAFPPAQVGDRAVLFGDSQAEPVPTADDWAQASGTINYEIVTQVGERVPRVYRVQAGASATKLGSEPTQQAPDDADQKASSHAHV